MPKKASPKAKASAAASGRSKGAAATGSSSHKPAHKPAKKKVAYDEKASALADMFQKNFVRFEAGSSAEICAAGPKGAAKAQ